MGLERSFIPRKFVQEEPAWTSIKIWRKLGKFPVGYKFLECVPGEYQLQDRSTLSTFFLDISGTVRVFSEIFVKHFKWEN